KEAEQYEDLQKAATKLKQFVKMIEELRELSETTPLDSFYDALIDKTGYVRALEAKATDDNLTRIENVQELKSNIVNFLSETEGGTLFDFLNEIALYTDLDQYDKSDDSVVMMTMHSAKGLEFPTVFIVGAEEGIFPGIRSIGEPEEMEEERRLCYVAMTRAKKKLYFTSARQRMIFGKTTAGRTSRFVDEISDENIDRPASAVVGYRFEEADEDNTGPDSRSHRTAGYEYRAQKTTAKRDLTSYPLPPAPAAAPAVSYLKGDVVKHKAFGRGMITDVQPAGGDALLEVAFDSVGTKRLMAKSAAAYMQKIQN
ncbi:MAG: ATP-binding domain-containing protein, partial [Clostridiales bacterium]|nr:ATP-binding domain-containing protein [Clostridiales bacterium]